MSEDKPLKSAVELALERLKSKDADTRPPTDEQKAAIAEARNFYEAKLAEIEVLHQSKLKTTWDPEQRETLIQDYRRERERLTSERDAKLERIRAPHA